MSICQCHRAPAWKLVSLWEMFIDCVFSVLGSTSLLVLCSLGMNNAHAYGHFALSIESYQACFIPEKQSLEESQTGRSARTGACSLWAAISQSVEGEVVPFGRTGTPKPVLLVPGAGVGHIPGARRRFPGEAGGGSRAPGGGSRWNVTLECLWTLCRFLCPLSSVAAL